MTKRALLLFFLAGSAWASGPIYTQKDAVIQEEFENVYKDIRSVPNGRYQSSSMTLQGLTADSATITNLTVGSLTTSGALGKLIQIVTGTTSSGDTTTSTSFTDTSVTVAITPTSASNKILVIASGSIGSSKADINSSVFATLARGTTNLGNANFGFCGVDNSVAAVSGVQWRVPCAMAVLDSPATTSATTYKVQFKTTLNTVTATWGLGNQTIIVAEVAP